MDSFFLMEEKCIRGFDMWKRKSRPSRVLGTYKARTLASCECKLTPRYGSLISMSGSKIMSKVMEVRTWKTICRFSRSLKFWIRPIGVPPMWWPEVRTSEGQWPGDRHWNIFRKYSIAGSSRLVPSQDRATKYTYRSSCPTFSQLYSQQFYHQNVVVKLVTRFLSCLLVDTCRRHLWRRNSTIERFPASYEYLWFGRVRYQCTGSVPVYNLPKPPT